LAENASMIEEVSRGDAKKRRLNNTFVGLSPHHALTIAA
jgi:hypothetical protein